jgi:hypothetical protein
MTETLATHVSDLTERGWELKRQSATRVELEARRPFNWSIFGVMAVLFPLLGGLAYAAFWALMPKVRLSLSDEHGAVVTGNGTPLGATPRRDPELARMIEAELRPPQGFWRRAAPTLLAMALVVGVWAAAIGWASQALF